MTLVARKLRLTTTRELEAAEQLFEQRTVECQEIRERIDEMQRRFPSLCGMPGVDEGDMPEGLQAVYDKQVLRYDLLAKFLMEYHSVLQTTLEKQQNTRNKAGELVSSVSVGVFIQRVLQIARMYVPATHRGRFDDEATEVYKDFLRENPAAVLSKAGRDREEEDDRS